LSRALGRDWLDVARSAYFNGLDDFLWVCLLEAVHHGQDV
jgi:hypothetical protein